MNNGGKPLVSVVIPVYCEADIIETTLHTIYRTLTELNVSFNIIVIDDGSSDDTWQVLESLQEIIPVLEAQRFSRNFGKESAILAGLKYATGQAVVLMDGDLQHPPELLPEMIQIWQSTDVDVVETVKVQQQTENLIRRMGTHLFYSLMYILTNYDMRKMSDYKLMDRKVVDAWLELGEYNRFFRGLVAWLGFKHVEINFVVPERPGGSSSWSLYALVKFAIQAMTSFSSRPLHAITFMGIGFLGMAIILGLRVAYQVIIGTAISGFATIIFLQLIIGSIIMIGLGLIGIYIASIYDEVKRRPHFIIESELKPKQQTEISSSENAVR